MWLFRIWLVGQKLLPTIHGLDKQEEKDRSPQGHDTTVSYLWQFQTPHTIWILLTQMDPPVQNCSIWTPSVLPPISPCNYSTPILATLGFLKCKFNPCLKFYRTWGWRDESVNSRGLWLIPSTHIGAHILRWMFLSGLCGHQAWAWCKDIHVCKTPIYLK